LFLVHASVCGCSSGAMAPAIATSSPRLGFPEATSSPKQVNSPLAADGDGPMPDWIVDCDVITCQVLQDVSAQIVANCKSFGVQLGGVCGKAIERLPAEGKTVKLDSDSVSPFDDDACSGFLTAFHCLSQALLQLAVDLESTVTLPLQTAVATFNEESVGRVKHWRQVRSRLIELQELYGRSRQRSAEARGKLESSQGGGWFKTKSTGKKAAAEQHSAMCDLARCEEELRESEASLRKLEAESKERLQQLDQEKRALLQGVLTKGARSLRKLRLVADKAPSTPPEPSARELQAGEGDAWQGVMPQVGGDREEGVCDSGTLAQAKPEAEPEEHAPSEVVPSDPGSADAAGEAPVAADPSSKYLQGAGKLDHVADAEFQELAELGDGDSEEDDAAARAKQWSPARLKAASAARTARAKRSSSLIFQSGDPLVVARPSASPQRNAPCVAGSAASSGGGSAASSGGSPGPDASRKANSLLYRVTASAASSLDQPRPGSAIRPSTSAKRLPSLPDSPTTAPATPSKSRSEFASPPFLQPTETFGSSSSSTAAALPRTAAPSSTAAATATATNRCLVDDSDSEEEIPRSRSTAKATESPQPPPHVDFQMSPVVAEDPRKCFERYAKRLSERFGGATEMVWSRLEERAAETPPGAFVGKLECFWLLRPDEKPTPESASGLVCFQFVQGFAANFARVLHLSVVDPDHQKDAASEGSTADSMSWRDALPSALLEVRRFIFGMLDVVSIRSVVLAGEDADGLIYVDEDVEAAYQQSRFRWFQLTQNIRRTRSGLTRKKIKKASRFLVLHSARGPDDPAAPRTATMAPQPALLMRDDPQGAAAVKDDPLATMLRSESVDAAKDDDGELPVFSAF